MSKYIALIKYEIKNALKDRITLFMILYPFLMLFVTGFFVPEILSRTNTDIIATSYTNTIMLLMNITIGSMMGGFLLGFSFIENKDEKTFNTIAVTPASLKGYIVFKSIYYSILAIIGNIIIFFGLVLLAKNKLLVFNGITTVSLFENIKLYHLAVIAIVNGLLTPAFAMVIASIAKNKVEGFVFVKFGGIILMLPLLMMLEFFNGGTQYILAFLPHFWCTKALYNIALNNTNQANLSFWLYNLIGLIYTIGITIIAYGYFNRKLQITT